MPVRLKPLLDDERANGAEVEKLVFRLRQPLTELAPRYLDAVDLPVRLARLLKPMALSEAEIAAIAESLGQLIAASKRLHGIEGLGPVLVENIVEWFTDEHNKRVLAKMLEAGVNMRAEEKEVAQAAGWRARPSY